MKFKEAQERAAEKGWRLERLTGDPEAKHRYRHYMRSGILQDKTGYVVFDGEDCYRWQTLGDFVLNCLESDRWIDGFMRR